jgi:serine/threonine protein kinase
LRTVASLALVVAGCTPSPPPGALRELDAIEYQWSPQPVDSAWKAARPMTALHVEPPPAKLWLRVRTPAVDAPDPALRLGRGLFLESIWVDGRPVELGVMPLVVPLGPTPSTVLVRSAPPVYEFVPQVHVGSQRALWSATMRHEVPEAIVGGTLLLTGLLMLAATLRRGSAHAQRGLGLFLAPLGVITLTQLSLLRHLLLRSGEAIVNTHEVASFLYPIGFAGFALATFGEGRSKLLSRGRAAYVGYATLAWALHLLGWFRLAWSRALIYPFILTFAGYTLALAARKAREGDPAARTFLWGIGALLALSLPDMLEGLELIAFDTLPVQSVPFAVLAFGAAMSIVIERRHAQTRDALQVSATELSHKVEALEERNEEVQTLNRELRRQIAERSRQMGDALQLGVAATSGRSVREGDVLDGRYRVVRALGRGGMGAVYEVERVTDARHFALKMLEGQASSAAAVRFAREAEITASLSHEHLVSVVDVGGTSGASLYLVMELVEGRSLDAAHARFGDVPWATAVLAQVASALAALHAAGVVHRDLKPGNVLLSECDDGAPHAKISDFGISRLDTATDLDTAERVTREVDAADAAELHGAARTLAAADAQAATLPAPPTALQATQAQPNPSWAAASRGGARANALTATGVLMGTPAYMAPELSTGARGARPTSDVFAFGLIAWELLTGAHAFGEPPIFRALAGRALGDAAPLPASLDARLAETLRRCLTEAPESRPSAIELATLFATVVGAAPAASLTSRASLAPRSLR